MRNTSKGLHPGTRIRVPAHGAYRAKRGEVIRIEDSPKHGVIVWFKDDITRVPSPAPLAIVKAERKVRYKKEQP